MYPALDTESKMINPGFQSGWEGVTEGERHCRRKGKQRKKREKKKKGDQGNAPDAKH